MDTPIFSLVYSSKAIVSINDETLKNILDVSRVKNKKLDITGFLAVRDDRFLQLLEGPEANVRDCLESIIRDPRHTNLRVLAETHYQTRIMPDWSMAWVKLDQQRDSAEDILDLFDLGLSGAQFKSPEAIMTMIRLFSNNAVLLT